MFRYNPGDLPPANPTALAKAIQALGRMVAAGGVTQTQLDTVKAQAVKVTVDQSTGATYLDTLS